MGKRPNTVKVNELSTLATPKNWHIETIHRDEFEQYKLLVSNGDLKVIDGLTGHNYHVEADPAAMGYLALSGNRPLSKAFQTLNVIDSTLVLNKTKTVRRLRRGEDTTPPAPTVMRRAELTVSRHPYPYTDSLPGSNKFGYTDGNECFYIFNVNGTEYRYEDAEAPIASVVGFLSERIREDYSNATVMLEGETIVVTLNAGDEIDISGEWQRHVTKHYFEGGTTTTTSGICLSAEYRAVSVTPPDPRRPSALWYIKQADYATEYSVQINGTKCYIKTPEATSELAREGLRTSTMAHDMALEINSKTSLHSCIAVMVGNVLYIEHSAGEDFTIKANDDLGDRASYAIKEWVDDFNKLPPEAPEGFRVEIRGAPEANVDPYHVIYKSQDQNGSAATGLWEETLKHGADTDIDVSTMPHRLSRKQDATYVTAENPQGIYFKFAPAEYAPRTVGDDLTAPFPSFVTEGDTARKITSMGFHKNRLSFTTDTNIVFSEAGSFMNFFPTTVVTTLDADPIDIALSINAVAPVEHMLEVETGLLLFAPKLQLLLTSGDIFNTDSISTDVVSRYDMEMSVAPVSHGAYVYFCTKNTKASQVMEYGPRPNTSKWEAINTTAHVPTYVQGHVTKFTGSTTERTLLLPTLSAQGSPVRHLYVNNYVWNGAEKLQNAWHKWTFAGDILDAFIARDEVSLLVHYPDEGKTYLERMVLSHDALKDELGHNVYLDRREEVDSSFVLPEGDPRTVFRNKGRSWVGFRYTQKYVFSEFFVRNNERQAITAGRLQLRYLSLAFHDTTNFTVTVERRGVDARSKTFEGRVLGSIQSLLGDLPVVGGVERFTIHSKSDNVIITITNETEQDAVFHAAEWEGTYALRTRRM